MKEENMEMHDAPHPDKARDGNRWSLPQPETLIRPTYWPAVLAFGCLLLGFGVLTSYLFSAVGGIVSIIAVLKWIGEIVYEQQK